MNDDECLVTSKLMISVLGKEPILFGFALYILNQFLINVGLMHKTQGGKGM